MDQTGLEKSNTIQSLWLIGGLFPGLRVSCTRLFVFLLLSDTTDFFIRQSEQEGTSDFEKWLETLEDGGFLTRSEWMKRVVGIDVRKDV